MLTGSLLSSRRKSPGERKIFAQFSCFLGILSLRALYDIFGIEVDDALEIAEQTEV